MQKEEVTLKVNGFITKLRKVGFFKKNKEYLDKYLSNDNGIGTSINHIKSSYVKLVLEGKCNDREFADLTYIIANLKKLFVEKTYTEVLKDILNGASDKQLFNLRSKYENFYKEQLKSLNKEKINECDEKFQSGTIIMKIEGNYKKLEEVKSRLYCGTTYNLNSYINLSIEEFTEKNGFGHDDFHTYNEFICLERCGEKGFLLFVTCNENVKFPERYDSLVKLIKENKFNGCVHFRIYNDEMLVRATSYESELSDEGIEHEEDYY